MITRFAPSPTGPLHLGHAYSAILAHDMARAAGGSFLLRIEDIDPTRCRPEWEEMIYDDLSWLGLSWEPPVMRQSERLDAYHDALLSLWQDRSRLYPCACTRREIEDAAKALPEGIRFGPDGIIYPGTCRHKPARNGQMPKNINLRLDMGALGPHDTPISFVESGPQADGAFQTFTHGADEFIQAVGDIVISRRDMGTSYHLSVVIDDALQGITHVVRGADLFEATKIHALLQRLLGLPTPHYHHHRLILDDQGKRLAKRDDARAIAKYREDGASPQDIRQLVGL